MKKIQPILHRMKNLKKLVKSNASMQVQRHLNLSLIVTRARQNRQLTHTYNTKFSLINNIILILTFFENLQNKKNHVLKLNPQKFLLLGGQLSNPHLN